MRTDQTTAEWAAQARKAAQALRRRAASLEVMTEVEDAGYPHLAVAFQRAEEYFAERAEERAAEAEARAERVAKIRASGRRMALPELDAGLGRR